MSKIAVYPGSFDPPHYGHINILEEATKIFDKVIVLISTNPAKKEFLPIEEKVLYWDKILFDYALIENVELASNNKDLTVVWMKDRNFKYMIRGVRNSHDFDEESTLYSVNRKINMAIRTIFIPANPFQDMNISSSIIRELIKFKVSRDTLQLYTPDCIVDKLMEKFYG